MPFRLGPHDVKVQFSSSAKMPFLANKAAVKRKLPSNSAYYRLVICEAIAKDLGLPLEEVMEGMPDSRTSTHLFGGTRSGKIVAGSSSNTIETVR